MRSLDALQAKVALITGATDGIGLTTAKHMAQMGYTILMHGRKEERLQQAKATVEKFCGSSSSVVTLPPCDLSTMDGSRSLAQHVVHNLPDNRQLNVLMNNAGVYCERLSITDDGLEQTFAVNVLAPFIVSSLLLPHTKGRIVIASSLSQCRSIRDWSDVAFYNKRTSYSAHGAYSESKLLDAMLSFELAERLSHRGITCNCLDPGTVNTKMLLAGWGPIGISVRDALDETWLCTSPELEGVTGEYFVHRSKSRASGSAYDSEQRTKLWSLLTKLAPDAGVMWELTDDPLD